MKSIEKRYSILTGEARRQTMRDVILGLKEMALRGCYPPLKVRVPRFLPLCAPQFVCEKRSALSAIGIADVLSFSTVALSTALRSCILLAQVEFRTKFCLFQLVTKGSRCLRSFSANQKKKEEERKTTGVSCLCDVSTYPPLKIA